jgi:hypothetical protein
MSHDCDCGDCQETDSRWSPWRASKMEERAAEIAAESPRGRFPKILTDDELAGWSAYPDYPISSTDPYALIKYAEAPLTGWIASRWAGWLAREIVTNR